MTEQVEMLNVTDNPSVNDNSDEVNTFKISIKAPEDPENRIIKGYAEHTKGSLTFSQSLIPFEERVKNLEVLGKLFELNCTITDLIEENNRRLRIF